MQITIVICLVDHLKLFMSAHLYHKTQWTTQRTKNVTKIIFSFRFEDHHTHIELSNETKTRRNEK